MEHQSVTSSFQWGKFILRADLPKTTKDIALALILWGDEDGSNVRPGNRRLAAAFDIEERSVREHLKILRDLGLIERVGFGRAGGKADVYQLTTPGAGYPEIPMLFDPHWQRLAPKGTGRARTLTSIRAAAAEARKAAAEARQVAQPPAPPTIGHLVGTAASGTWVPEGSEAAAVEETDYRHPGAASPAVDNSDFRHPGAGSDGRPDETYRHPGAELPAPGCRTSGTRVPPTTQTTHDHPTNLAGSSQASTSPETQTITTPDLESAPRVVHGSAVLQPDPAAAAAIAAFLASLPNDGEWFRAMAIRRLRAAGWASPTEDLIAHMAAQLASQADPETRTA